MKTFSGRQKNRSDQISTKTLLSLGIAMIPVILVCHLGLRENVTNRLRAQRTAMAKAAAGPIRDFGSENKPAALPSFIPNQPAHFQLPADTRIPILMYHYIRDYSNSHDRLGINLSVSPTVFSQQLNVLKAAGYTTITFNDLNQPLPGKPVILTFDDGYADAYTTALPALQAAQMRGVFYIVSSFVDKDHYVTSDQVKALDAAGMEIGSHTVNHVDLATRSMAVQTKELGDSKQFLEALLQKPVTAFCYPAGRYNATTVGLDSQFNYSSATTTNFGIATGGDFNTHPYQLNRVRVTQTTDLLKVLGDQP